MRQALAFAGLALSAGIAVGTACGSAMDGYDPTVPTNIIYVDGADQRGRVGTALHYPLLAKITNQFGGPVAGVRVDWYLVAGRGILADTMSVSDAEGLVCNTLRLSPRAETIRVQAVTALSGSPLYFNATAVLAPDRGDDPNPGVCSQ
ncbi:MAG: hypothetical protein H6Q77_360 [Gemmatimonadetes bacterium]|nr:hypothetical protein [Gemmatimonadota bacterium]